MPAGLELVRTTPEFSDTTVPAALLAAHRVAPGVWGRLRVRSGQVQFRFDAEPATIVELSAGDHVDIPPDVVHRVEPVPGARFVVEFYRAPSR
jgi:tellurite methyltransferase